MTDLDRLIAAVEAGTWPVGNPCFEIIDLRNWMQAGRAFDGSLDAAKRLHDALLPGDARVNDLSQDGKGRWYVVIACDIQPHYFYGNNADPARSWLLAILRAVKTKGEQG